MSYHNSYIIDGFADDCDELIERCHKEETLTFEMFCVNWQEMQMGSLYQGRTSGAEIAEISEEVLQIAKPYMTTTAKVEDSVAGLFLIYALLNLQPYSGFAPLRVVQDDLPAIHRLEHMARRQHRLDVLYILGSVLIQGPVQYHAEVRERGMEIPIRKYLEGYNSHGYGERPKGVFLRQNTERHIIKEMINLGEKYTAAKEALQSDGPKDPSLAMVHGNLGKDLDETLKKLLSGIFETIPVRGENGDGSESSDSDDGDRARKIKQKAMKAKVNPMQHLLGVTDKPLKKKKSDNSKTSPRKKAREPSTPKTTRNKKTKVTPEHTKNTDFLPSLDDDADELTFKTLGKEENEEQEAEIEIDSLPSIIRNEDQGKLIEIEIIDNKHPSPSKSTPKTRKRCNNDRKEVNRKRRRNKYAYTGSFLNPNPDKLIPKPEKRDFKKTAVKSRFQRMGMLPIANFPVDKNKDGIPETVTSIDEGDLSNESTDQVNDDGKENTSESLIELNDLDAANSS